MSATIKDVAKLAGVSPSTVSRVLNDSYLVKKDTARQVLEAVKKLNYRPNDPARSLRTDSSSLIGFIGLGLDNVFISSLLRGIKSGSLDLGYAMLFGDSDGEYHQEIYYLDLMEQKRVEGIILISSSIDSKLLNNIKNRDFPVVIASAIVTDHEIACVSVDNLTASYEATEYLIKRGCQKIGIIRGPYADLVTSEERIKGLRLAFKNHNIPYVEDYVYEGDFTYESGYEGASFLLESMEEIHAIYAFNDAMAIGAMKWVLEKGLRVPEDISIMGFDDIEINKYVRPTLTSVAQSGYDLGLKSVEMLNRLIKGENLKHKNKLYIPHRLIVRGSTR